MMKSAFYFILKAFFALKILQFLFCHFGRVEKRLDQKVKIYFTIYDVTAWEANNYNTHTVQYIKNKANQAMKFGQLIEQNYF